MTMTLQQKLERIGTALVDGVGNNVFHYWRPMLNPPFCVWGEDAESLSFHADRRKAEQVIGGYVDYYTKTEYDPSLDAVQTALRGLSEDYTFSWRLESVDFEEETNLIHYSWSWEMA